MIDEELIVMIVEALGLPEDVAQLALEIARKSRVRKCIEGAAVVLAARKLGYHVPLKKVAMLSGCRRGLFRSLRKLGVPPPSARGLAEYALRRAGLDGEELERILERVPDEPMSATDLIILLNRHSPVPLRVLCEELGVTVDTVKDRTSGGRGR